MENMHTDVRVERVNIIAFNEEVDVFHKLETLFGFAPLTL